MTGQISSGLNLGASTTKIERVVIDDAARIVLSDEWTISAWYRNLLSGGGSRRALVGGDWGDIQLAMVAFGNGAGTMRTNYYYASAAQILRTAAWQHVTVVGRGTNTEIYLNGVSNGVAYYKSTNDVKYLGNAFYDYKFAEDLDEFRIERKARSAGWMRARWMNEASNSVFVSNSVALATGNVDNNGNGIPDWWEVLTFGGTNVVTSTTDRDQDKFSDHDEWVAGTDMTNAASLLRLGATRTNGQSVVSFDMLPETGEWYTGRTRYYDLQWSTNLVKPSGGWMDMDGMTNIPGESRTVAYTNIQSDAVRIYRVKARLGL
jgi:hypothetical protein